MALLRATSLLSKWLLGSKGQHRDQIWRRSDKGVLLWAAPISRMSKSRLGDTE